MSDPAAIVPTGPPITSSDRAITCTLPSGGDADDETGAGTRRHLSGARE